MTDGPPRKPSGPVPIVSIPPAIVAECAQTLKDEIVAVMQSRGIHGEYAIAEQIVDSLSVRKALNSLAWTAHNVGVARATKGTTT